MTKIILSTLIFCFITLNNFAQYWEKATPFPDATGFINNDIYGTINCMETYNNELIVAGSFSDIGGIVAHCIARWNGNNWNTVGIGNFLNVHVTDIAVYNNILYVFAEKLYSWNGNNLVELTYFDPNSNQTESFHGSDLNVYNGELYISNGNSLAKYNGNIFTFYPTTNSNINCVENFNNDLYIGTNEGLFKLQNNNWVDVNGICTNPPTIYEIEVYNNDLFVFGEFSSIGGITCTNFAKYNGNNWSNIILPFNNIASYVGFGINHLKKINSELYFASSFMNISSTNNYEISPVIKFNGNTWTQVAQNKAQGGECVHLYNNTLFCGGKFTMYGMLNWNLFEVRNLAKLNNFVNINELIKEPITISPNPIIGDFTITGLELYNKIISMQITDMNGKLIKELDPTASKFTLGTVQPGVYFLTISAGNKQDVIKLIKE